MRMRSNIFILSLSIYIITDFYYLAVAKEDISLKKQRPIEVIQTFVNEWLFLLQNTCSLTWGQKVTVGRSGGLQKNLLKKMVLQIQISCGSYEYYNKHMHHLSMHCERNSMGICYSLTFKRMFTNYYDTRSTWVGSTQSECDSSPFKWESKSMMTESLRVESQSSRHCANMTRTLTCEIGCDCQQDHGWGHYQRLWRSKILTG